MSEVDFRNENLSGLLLVATPNLVDPFFRKTVILLMHHSKQDGSLGFVLNRPLNLLIGDVIPQIQDANLSQVPLYYGGPVSLEQPILLGIRYVGEESLDVRKFPVEDIPTELLDDWTGHLQMFVGHAGWSPGQLEKEIDQNSWLVLPSHFIAPSQTDPEEVWRKILGSMNPVMKLVAEMPDEIWKN